MQGCFSRRRCLSVVFAALIAGMPAGSAVAASAQHSSVRLLDGGRGAAGRLAGIEIRLDPGFITYWRSPGEAGVPPVFDFSGSLNVKEAKVLYPAPRLIDEDGIAAYGYEGRVTFPVEVTAKEASVPVRLDLALDYAVCSNICLPAKAHVTLDFDAPAVAGDADLVRGALAGVPKSAYIGEPGPLGIESVAWASPTTLVVTARAIGGPGMLFAEAPEPWYFSVSPAHAEDGGKGLAFDLKGPDHPPAGPLPAGPLRLTLVGASGGIEVTLHLDALAPKP